MQTLSLFQKIYYFIIFYFHTRKENKITNTIQYGLSCEVCFEYFGGHMMMHAMGTNMAYLTKVCVFLSMNVWFMSLLREINVQEYRVK